MTPGCNWTAVRTSIALVAMAMVGGPLASPSNADVLVDQTTGAPGGFVASEQFAGISMGECGFAGEQTCTAADDFRVPPGSPWQLQALDVQGQGTALTVLPQIYRDAGGLPGSSLNFLGFADQSAGTGEWHGTLFGVLQPGTYWLSAVGSSAWSWRTQAPQSGSEAAWQSAGCAGGAWQHVSTCGQPGPDLRFRITGQPITTDFKLGKPKRKHNGGFLIIGTFPPTPGQITLDEVGAGGRDLIESAVKSIRKSRPTEKRLPINPTPATKRKLKKRKKVEVKVQITYIRRFVFGLAGEYKTTPNVKTLKVVLFQKWRRPRH